MMFSDFKKLILKWIEKALGNLASFFAGYFTGKGQQQQEQMEKEIDNLHEAAERPANRPNTDLDINGVFDRWKNINNNKKKP